MSRLIFLDTETTGLEVAQDHRIIEIACVEMIGRRFTKENFQCHLNPEREIDIGAQNIHGLSLEFLADKPRFADIADDFLRFIEGAEIVIHNAAFDVGFLNAELKRAGRARFDGPHLDTGEIRVITDTWKLAREQFPGKKITSTHCVSVSKSTGVPVPFTARWWIRSFLRRFISR